MGQCLGVSLFVSYNVGDRALGFGHASQTLYHWNAPQLVTHVCKNQTFLLRGPALGVMLGGTGPLLAQQRGHLLSISVLHSLQQAVVILVPLVGLGSKRLRKRGEWLQPHRCQTKPSSQPAAPPTPSASPWEHPQKAGFSKESTSSLMNYQASANSEVRPLPSATLQKVKRCGRWVSLLIS